MIIRDMETRDLPVVAWQEKQIFSDYWSEEAFEESLHQARAMLVVAEDTSGELMGYACVYTALDEGELMNIAVFPQYRKQHVGDAILAHLIERLRGQKVQYFYLEVRESNTPAQKLYEKHGFVRVGLRKNFYEQPREHAWVMACEL